MYDTRKAMEIAHKPMTSVTNGKGAFGFISEVSINDSQDSLACQIGYSVTWLIGSDKSAWWSHGELVAGENIMMAICDGMRHPFSSDSVKAKDFFK